MLQEGVKHHGPKSKGTAIQTLALIICAFIFCYILYWIVAFEQLLETLNVIPCNTFIDMFTSSEALGYKSHHYVYLLPSVIFLFINSILNPVVYYFQGSRFKGSLPWNSKPARLNSAEQMAAYRRRVTYSEIVVPFSSNNPRFVTTCVWVGSPGEVPPPKFAKPRSNSITDRLRRVTSSKQKKRRTLERGLSAYTKTILEAHNSPPKQTIEASQRDFLSRLRSSNSLTVEEDASDQVANSKPATISETQVLQTIPTTAHSVESLRPPSPPRKISLVMLQPSGLKLTSPHGGPSVPVTSASPSPLLMPYKRCSVITPPTPTTSDSSSNSLKTRNSCPVTGGHTEKPRRKSVLEMLQNPGGVMKKNQSGTIRIRKRRGTPLTVTSAVIGNPNSTKVRTVPKMESMVFDVSTLTSAFGTKKAKNVLEKEMVSIASPTLQVSPPQAPPKQTIEASQRDFLSRLRSSNSLTVEEDASDQVANSKPATISETQVLQTIPTTAHSVESLRPPSPPRKISLVMLQPSGLKLTSPHGGPSVPVTSASPSPLLMPYKRCSVITPPTPTTSDSSSNSLKTRNSCPVTGGHTEKPRRKSVLEMLQNPGGVMKKNQSGTIRIRKRRGTPLTVTSAVIGNPNSTKVRTVPKMESMVFDVSTLTSAFGTKK
eukprot:sb/3462823/